jgi:hypothetical protein
MKKFITYFVCGLFLISLGGNLSAVEKQDKKSAKQEVVAKKQKTPQKGALQLRNTKPTVQKRYDTFIDQNKNGIDDRRENLKAKPPAKTAKKEEEKKK